MIVKRQKMFKRRSRVWEKGYLCSDDVAEYVRRDIYLLLGVIPLYITEEILDRPR